MTSDHFPQSIRHTKGATMSDEHDEPEAVDIVDHALAALRSANPISGEVVARLHTEPVPQALFQEIIMQNTTSTSEIGQPQTREHSIAHVMPLPLGRPRRPVRRFLLAGAAALAVAASVAALVIVPASSKPASAKVLAAAQRSAAAISGNVKVSIVITAGSQLGTANYGSRYSGEDVELTFDTDMTPNATASRTTMRVVGGKTYVLDPGVGDGWRTGVGETTGTEFLKALGLPTTPDPRNDAIVEMVRSADSVHMLVARPDTNPSVGTVPDDTKLELQLAIDRDGNLSEVVVSFTGLTPPGDSVPSSGHITTTYSELGKVGAIEAPADAKPLDVLAGLNPDQRAALDTLADLEKRKPNLCVGGLVGGTEVDAAAESTLLACLESNGEHAAAEAFKVLMRVGKDSKR
jgi:hypothetical protein